MNDQELIETWTALEPTADQRRRVQTRVFTWLEAHDTSLAAEWIGLVRIAPVGALGLAALSAVAIVAATPLAWLARALAGALM